MWSTRGFFGHRLRGPDTGAHTWPGRVAAPPVDGRVHHIFDDSVHARGEGLV